MRASVASLLAEATRGRSAVAAFNVYSLHQAAGVVEGAARAQRAVILQVHPAGVREMLTPMLAALTSLRDDAAVPIAVQLDHAGSLGVVSRALSCGIDGIMLDGSALGIEDNAQLVRRGRGLLPPGLTLEGELGRLSGSEDGTRVATGTLTEPGDVASFVDATGIDALAVSIGNVHGATSHPPAIDLDRLRAIARATKVPLVLHGASGLSADVIGQTIRLGVAKINVNTEIRGVYLQAIRGQELELTLALEAGREAVAEAVHRIILSLQAR